MVMQAMSKGATHPVIKTLLFGLLMLAAVGLMLTGGNGFFRNGMGFSIAGDDVIKVGHESVSLPEFDHELRSALAQIGLQPKQAYQLGYVNQVAGQEIRIRLMSQAAHDDNILIARSRVADQIRKIIQPHVQPGQNEEDVLKNLLMNKGISEGQLVNSINREMTGSLLAGMIQGGFADLSDNMLKDFYDSENEKRDAQYIVFYDKDVADVSKPNDSDLQKFYEESKEDYAIPETRAFQIIRVKGDNLKKTLQISDDEIKKYYDDNKENYSQVAERTVEQGLFNSQDQAQKVADAVKSGKPMDQAIKEVTNSSVAYLGSQDVEDAKPDEAKLQDELKKPVLAATQPGIIGPVKTALGWEIANIKKITPASIKSFDAVKEDIRKDMTATKLSDAQYNLSTQVDDMLASGAKVEDVAKKLDIEVIDLPPVNQLGQGPDGKDAFKAFDKTGPALLQTGYKLSQDETSRVQQMSDNSFMAVHLKTVTPKSYKPFDSVKDGLAKKWLAQQQQMENKMKVAGYLEEIKGGKTLSDIAKAHNAEIKTISALGRKDPPPKPLSPESAGGIFNAKINTPVLVDAEGGTGIAVPIAFKWPANVDPKGKDFVAFKTKFLSEFGQEALNVYAQSKTKKYGAVINEGLLAKTYGAASDAPADNGGDAGDQ